MAAPTPANVNNTPNPKPCPYLSLPLTDAMGHQNDARNRFEDIEVSSGPDVFLYLTTDESNPNDVDAEGSVRVELDDSERGTFSFTGTFTQTTLPDGFVGPDESADEVSVYRSSVDSSSNR